MKPPFPSARQSGPVAAAVTAVLAALLLDLLLILPNHPAAMTWQALELFPLELVPLLLLLLALPARGALSRLAVTCLWLLLFAGMLMKLTDLGTYAAYNRPFNPVVDLWLFPAAWNLARGSLGVAEAVAAVAGMVVALGVAAGLLWWSLRRWQRIALPRPAFSHPLAAGLAVLAALPAVLDIGHLRAGWRADPPGAAFTARLAIEQVETTLRSRVALAEFRKSAGQDPLEGRSDLFGKVAGHDIVVLFVESYGRASFDNPLYAPTHEATLRRGAAEIRGAGLAMRSGWLTSPVEGGQSWLAHTTFASGLRIDDQVRYATLLHSPRRTLWQLGAASGWQTVAVAPLITFGWPEGAALGFQTRLTAAEIGYKGAPYDWVTMPDQFTLSYIARQLAADAGGPERQPKMLEASLASSHAPWTPVARMRDWQDVAQDGANMGPLPQDLGPDQTPQAVWSAPETIRDHYRRAIDYSLQAVTGFAALQGARKTPPLIVVLGDHQAAGFVSQKGGRDVPVHLIGPPDVIAAFDSWGFTPGMIPAADAPRWPMEAFRDRFVRALSTETAAPHS